MPHSIQHLLAHRDPEPETGPDEDGIGDYLRGILTGFADRFTGNQDMLREMGVPTGAGVAELLSPEGGTVGIAKASLPILGRVARGSTTNVANDVGFLRRLFGDVGVGDVNDALQRARRPMDAAEGAVEADFINSTLAPAVVGDRRSHLRGLANMLETDRGRAFVDVADRFLGAGGPRATQMADKAAIETLLEGLGRGY